MWGLLRGSLKLSWCLCRKALRIACWLIVLTVKGLVRQFETPSTTHGSARLATVRDLKDAGMVGVQNQGLLLGKIDGRVIQAPAHDHVLVTAPTRSGKTHCFVVPNLLQLSDASVVVNDPDGECYWMTHRTRRKQGKVYLWAPDAEYSHSINPLDYIRVGTPHEVPDAKLLAGLIMDPDKGSDPYWDRAAKSFLSALMLFVCHQRPPVLRTMAEVHHLLNVGTASFDMVLERMEASGVEMCRKEASAMRAMVSGKAKAQADGVLGSLRAHLEAWHNECLQRVTGHSDFNLAELRNGTTTLYVSVPPEQAEEYRSALRLIHGLALTVCHRHRGPDSSRVVFLWDEFASLGRMQPALSAIAIARKAGIQLCLVVQSSAQLEELYGTTGFRTFTVNCRTGLCFGVNDYDEAKRISDTIGATTVESRSSGSREGLADVLPDSLNTGTGETGRPVMTPDEILRGNRHTCLIFQASEHPIVANKLHVSDRQFNGSWDPWNQCPACLTEAFVDHGIADALALPGPAGWNAPQLGHTIVLPSGDHPTSRPD